MSWPTPSLRRRSKQVARRPQTRPAVEIVEDRTLLTAYIVDNAGDSGTGTLRDIIQRLNSDPSSSNTIDFQFDPDVPTTIALLTPLDAIIKPVVLNSTNRTDVTIDGGGGGFDAITLGIGSDGSTVQSLNIRNFAGAGVVVQSANDQVAGNIIGGVTTGVRVTGAGAINAQIEGNRIGVDAGNAAIPVTIGVLVNQAGTFAVAGNTIGNALTAGVQILNATAGGSVTSNFVGMTSSGTAGNGDGVQIFQSSNVTVGGADPDAKNYIGNSSGSGVVIAGASATVNFVLGNVIGFTAGSPALPAPNNYGVSINGSAGNTIGANQIDASLLSAVHLFNTPATGNAVAANLIGVQGTTPAAKNAIGIEIISGQDNTIGGANAGDGNTIVRAATAGVVISGTSSGNKFQGNFIGTDASFSTGLGNAFGVLILGGSNNVIGGTTPNSGEGNTIGGNTSAGVAVVGGVDNTVVQNAYVYANGPAGTIPAGDINVAATANGGIQPPVISTATVEGGNVNVVFEAGSFAPGSRVEFYLVSTSLPSRIFLDAKTVAADGTASFPAGTLTNDSVIVATATTANMGTSAFSAKQTIADLYTVVNTNPQGFGSLYQAIVNANNSTSLGPVAITFQLPPGPSIIIVDPAYPLPAVVRPVTINPTGTPIVTIQGGAGVAGGLVLQAGSGGSTVKGLAFTGFQGVALRIMTDSNTIDGVSFTSNGLGVDVSGSLNTISDATFSGNGVSISLGGSNNTVSGGNFSDSGPAITATGSGQKISGSTFSGPGGGTALVLNGSNFTISGDTFTAYGTAIIAAGTGHSISNGSFTNTTTGISISGSGHTISDDVFNKYSTGVSVAGTTTTISGGTFHGGGTAIALLGNTNVVKSNSIGVVDPADSSLAGNAIGILVQGADNVIGGPTSASRNLIHRSATTGIFLNGAGATGNLIRFNEIRGTATPTIPGASVGVTVVAGGSNRILDNDIRNYGVQGVSVVSGSGNSILGNTFQLNSAGSDRAISISTGANGGILPPQVLNVTPDGTILAFQIAISAGQPSLTNARIQVYELSPDGTLVNKPISPAGKTFNLVPGTNFVQIDVPGFDKSRKVLITVTSAGDDTSAFSNLSTFRPATDVVNTQSSGAGSLAFAIAAANAIANSDPSLPVQINFFLAGIEMATIPGVTGSVWVINVPTTLVINQKVKINGWGSTPPGSFTTPSIWLQPSGTNGTGLKFSQVYSTPYPYTEARSSAGSQLLGLGFYNFSTAAVEIDVDRVTVSGNQFKGPAPVIGPATAASSPPAFTGAGVLIAGGFFNTIGQQDVANGAETAAGANLFGSLQAAIRVDGGGGNYIFGNLVGTDGAHDYPNYDGIVVSQSTGNEIADNVVGFSQHVGILIQGDKSTHNRISMNQVGVFGPRAGSYAIPNATGILIDGAGSNWIGRQPANTRYGHVADSANVIGNNSTAGIIVQGYSGQFETAAENNTIAGNYIGTNSNALVLPNAIGIDLISASRNFIGATGAAGANVIGYSTNVGILIDSRDGARPEEKAAYNLVRNNYIGVFVRYKNPDVEGSDGERNGELDGNPIPNRFGMILRTAVANWIGPTPDAMPSKGATLVDGANFISSNSKAGLQLQIGSNGNILRGNLIGTGWVDTGVRTGDKSKGTVYKPFLGNLGPGVQITGGVANVIGDETSATRSSFASLTPGTANLINGNFNGIEVGGGSGLIIGGNQISQNLLNGMRVTGDLSGSATVATITGNVIGMNFTGKDNRNDQTHMEPTANGLSGVAIDPTSKSVSPRSAVGVHAVAVIGNIISSNGLDGVGVQPTGTDASPTGWYADVLIAGNFIGLNADGAPGTIEGRTYGNVLDGVGVSNTGGVVVGKESADDNVHRPNIISGNLGRGVTVSWLQGYTADSAHSTRIISNYIGTDSKGTATDLGGSVFTGNLSDGVFILGQAWVTIDSNTIAGNRAAGVHAYNSTSTFAGGLRIRSNFIGVPSTSGSTTGDFGNISDGVFLDHILAEHLLVAGGDENKGVAIEGNRIGGNHANGVQISTSSWIRINDNQIGDVAQIDSPTGQPPSNGNGSHGVFLNNSSDIVVGGGDGSWNTISGNRGDGVLILGNLDPTRGNTIAGNRIGLDASGSRMVGNLSSGIVVVTSSNNLIGADLIDPARSADTLKPRNIISGNGLYGVLIVGQEKTGGSYKNVMARNYIGTTEDGLGRAPNSSDGVFLLNTLDTAVGGWTRSDGNVISGNNGQGVRIFGEWARGNRVSSNFIGLNKDGALVDLGNSANGVILEQVAAGAGETNQILGNTISGNAQSGVMVTSTLGSPTGVEIQGNTIGLTAAGDSAAPNRGYGVMVFGASNVTIGGTDSWARNFISGNNLDGVLIYSPSTNAYADSNTLVGNYIGTDRWGTAAVPNGGSGVHVINGFDNQIGRDGSPRNVISGNNSSGVLVEVLAGYDLSHRIATPNRISGNYIGVGASGMKALGNGLYGVTLVNATGTLIGNKAGAAGAMAILNTVIPTAQWVSNVISGNGQVGVYLTGDTRYTQVLGNYLGVGVDGLAYDASGAPRGLRSAQAAILIDGNARFNLIGGLPKDGNEAVPGTGNIITQGGVAPPGADTIGVMINSPFATGNVIASNLIGLDASGRSGGNTVGVLLSNAQGATIGGAERTGWTAGTGPYSSFGNVISGNASAGVEIAGPLAANDRIYGNFIGTDITGNAQAAPRTGTASTPPYPPSQVNGVLIYQGSGHQVGAIGARNLISGNMVGVSIAALQPGAAEPSNNVVEANFIGTDATGMKAVPNYEFGVLITASGRNTIRGNLLSANGVAGVEILGGRSQSGGGTGTSLGNTITGNLIGTDAAGQVAFAVTDGTRQISPISQHPAITLPDGLVINYGFQNNGVVVIGASDNLVTGGNTISGNIQVGVYITRIDNLNNTYGVPTGNVVQGNNLGLNGIYGVFRYDAPNGNPADANTFAGTPIPIGDFVTGLNPTTPSNPATSILLGGQGAATPNRPRTATPPRRARPTLPSRPQLAQAARLQGTR